MNHRNFAAQMEKVSRILVCFLVLFASSAKIYSNPRQAFFSGIKADFSLFEENGKVGLKDQQGQIVIPAQYDGIGWSNAALSIVNNVTGYRKGELWGLINIQTSRITKAEFVDLSPGEGDLLIARKKLPGSIRIQAGCINTAGKEIIPFQYEALRVTSFRAIVSVRNGYRFKKGLIDLENKILIPLQYQNIYPLGTLRYGVENVDGKTAIFSEDGKQITNFLIDSISTFKKDLAVIYQNQRQGLIDRQGQIRLEPTFREITVNDDGSVNTRQADSWLVLNGENSLLRQINADSVHMLGGNLMKIKNGGKFQLTNEEFNPVSPDLFDDLGDLENNKILFRKENKTGLINSKGAVIVKSVYNDLILDKNFMRASVRAGGNNRWVVLDSLGNAITQKSYETIEKYNNAYFPVKNRGYWGALDDQGKEIIACVHDSLIQQLNNLVVVKFKGKYGIINLKEDWIVTPQPNRLQLINDDLYFEKNSRTIFLKSLKGDVIYFSDNPLEVKADHLLEYLPSGEIWKIDFHGIIANRFTTPENVEEVFPESEGFRAIKRDSRYGFVDSQGRLRIANRYEDVKEFHQSLAAAKIRGKWGFINKEDKIAIQPVYDEVTSFANDHALVQQKNLFGLVDTHGKLILPVRYDSISIISNERFLVKQNGYWGLADADGKMVINPKYDQLQDLNNGYVIVEREGKFGLLTLQGISTIPLLYDGLFYDQYHSQYIALKKASWQTQKF